MESAEIEVSEIYIDPRKADYIERHGVTEHDVLQVQLNAPKYFIFNAGRNGFDMIGPNREGRFLVVGITPVEGTTYRLITAYWNTDGRAERIYNGA